MKNTIDLLTIEEAKKLPPEILQCKASKDFNGYIDDDENCCWWLRSTANISDYVAVVVWSFGAVHNYGLCVNYFDVAVRPALRIEESLVNKLPRTKKGYVIYLNTKWIDISEYVGSPCLLKKKCIKEAHRFDGKSNNYDQSEIKDFIEKWYEKKLKKYCVEEDENVPEPITVQFTCNNISIEKPITEAFCKEVKYEPR